MPDLAEHTGFLVAIISGLTLILIYFVREKFKKYDTAVTDIHKVSGDLVKSQDEIKFNYLDRFAKLERQNNDNLDDIKEWMKYKFDDINKTVNVIGNKVDAVSEKVNHLTKEHNNMKELYFKTKIENLERET